MKFEDLLPIGSVVLLQGAKKKIVIMGIMPIKHASAGSDIAYDYLGVPYPEGYMSPETGLLFNHEKIEKVVFLGYENEERTIFIKTIQQIIDKSASVIE